MSTVGNRIRFGVVYNNKRDPLIVSESERFVYSKSSIQVDPLEVIYTCSYIHSDWTNIEVDTAKHLEIKVETSSNTVGSKKEVKQSYKVNNHGRDISHSYYKGKNNRDAQIKLEEDLKKKYPAQILEGIFCDLLDYDKIYEYISDLVLQEGEVEDILTSIAKLDTRKYKKVTTSSKEQEFRMFSRAMAIYAPLMLVGKEPPVTQEVYVENDEDIPFWMFTFKDALKLLLK